MDSQWYASISLEDIIIILSKSYTSKRWNIHNNERLNSTLQIKQNSFNCAIQKLDHWVSASIFLVDIIFLPNSTGLSPDVWFFVRTKTQPYPSFFVLMTSLSTHVNMTNFPKCIHPFVKLINTLNLAVQGHKYQHFSGNIPFEQWTNFWVGVILLMLPLPYFAGWTCSELFPLNFLKDTRQLSAILDCEIEIRLDRIMCCDLFA